MKYFNTLIIFFAIWLVASLINGVLSGICISVYEDNSFSEETFGLTILFSFIFSVPFVALVWFITLMAQVSGSKGFALFKTVIIATCICSVIAAMFFVTCFGNDFNGASYAVGLSILTAAITAVLIFRKQIKGNEETV